MTLGTSAAENRMGFFCSTRVNFRVLVVDTGEVMGLVEDPGEVMGLVGEERKGDETEEGWLKFDKGLKELNKGSGENDIGLEAFSWIGW